MATVYIAEFGTLGFAGNQLVQSPAQPSLANQTVAITTASVSCNAFGATTNFVEIHSDGVCSFAFGGAPTATTASMRLGANETRHYMVNPGMKLAVISNS